MSETLSKLIERVENAAGPDRVLDADIFRFISGRPNGAVGWAECPAYSASIDAALVLAERKFSKDFHFIELSIQARTHCELHDQRVFDALATADAATAPLAIILATLRALSRHERSGKPPP